MQNTNGASPTSKQEAVLIGRFLTAAMKKIDVDRGYLAEKTGMNEDYLRTILQGDHRPHKKNLEALCDAMALDKQDLLQYVRHQMGTTSALPSDRFSFKMTKGLSDKSAVASLVANQFLGHKSTDELLITDGTSLVHVWSAFYSSWKVLSAYPINLATNNVAIVKACFESEHPNLTVHVAPGRLDPQHGAILGPETLDWLRPICRRRTCVMSLTALDALLGPCGHDAPARAVKELLLEESNLLLLICDASKLGRQRDEIDTSAANPDAWHARISNHPNRLWVYTSLDGAVKTALEEIMGSFTDGRPLLSIVESEMKGTIPRREALKQLLKKPAVHTLTDKTERQLLNAVWLYANLGKNFRYIAAPGD